MENAPLGWMLALALGMLASHFLAVVGAIVLVVTLFRGVEASYQRTLLQVAFWSSLTVIVLVVVAYVRLLKGGGIGFGVELPSPGETLAPSLSPYAVFVGFVAETGMLGYLAFRKPWRYLPLLLVALAVYVRLTLPFFFEFP